MQLHSLLLGLIFAFTLFQTPEAHSPTTQKTCTPGISFWKLLDEVRVGYTDGRLGPATCCVKTVATVFDSP